MCEFWMVLKTLEMNKARPTGQWEKGLVEGWPFKRKGKERIRFEKGRELDLKDERKPGRTEKNVMMQELLASH